MSARGRESSHATWLQLNLFSDSCYPRDRAPACFDSAHLVKYDSAIDCAISSIRQCFFLCDKSSPSRIYNFSLKRTSSLSNSKSTAALPPPPRPLQVLMDKSCTCDLSVSGVPFQYCIEMQVRVLCFSISQKNSIYRIATRFTASAAI